MSNKNEMQIGSIGEDTLKSIIKDLFGTDKIPPNLKIITINAETMDDNVVTDHSNGCKCHGDCDQSCECCHKTSEYADENCCYEDTEDDNEEYVVPIVALFDKLFDKLDLMNNNLDVLIDQNNQILSTMNKYHGGFIPTAELQEAVTPLKPIVSIEDSIDENIKKIIQEEVSRQLNKS